eukprot:gene17026-13383_t
MDRSGTAAPPVVGARSRRDAAPHSTSNKRPPWPSQRGGRPLAASSYLRALSPRDARGGMEQLQQLE